MNSSPNTPALRKTHFANFIGDQPEVVCLDMQLHHIPVLQHIIPRYQLPFVNATAPHARRFEFCQKILVHFGGEIANGAAFFQDEGHLPVGLFARWF